MAAAASEIASSVGEVVDEPLVRQAAAFRTKYRVSDSLLRLPISQVGFHRHNRDGQPVSGLRCESLLKELLHYGFDVSEANTGGIVVAAGGSDSIEHFNIGACAGDGKLAPVVTGFIKYGSLSHSHLHQVLKNIAAGVRADVPGICSGDGYLSLELLR